MDLGVWIRVKIYWSLVFRGVYNSGERNRANDLQPENGF